MGAQITQVFLTYFMENFLEGHLSKDCFKTNMHYCGVHV